MNVRKKLAQWEIDEIVHHMNDDHSDSLLLYARHFGGCPTAISASLLEVNENSCSLSVQSQRGNELVVMDLKRPVGSIKQAETVMVEMHFEALRALNESDVRTTKEGS